MAFTELNKSQIKNKIKFIEDYIKADNAADGSKFDQNANVSSKNISTLHSELYKDFNIQLNRQLMHNKLTEMYGAEIADQYIRQLENHEIYKHDESSVASPYCASVSLYPFLLNGTKDLGGESEAPQHLESFCGSFINLVFALSSQFAGAIATVEFLMYFDYFARKDYGDDYLSNYPQIISQHLQQVIYSINQPASARGYQACFWNGSIFDTEYFNSIFGDFYFPDATKPDQKSVMALQKFFMTWFNKERERTLLTFPVMTAAVLTKDGKVVDNDFVDFLAKENSEGNSFFVYMSDSADSLASCCFDKDQEVLVKSSTNGVKRISIKDWYETKWDDKRNPKVFHDGSWVDGKLNKIPLLEKKMYRITTANNKTLVVTEDHIHPTIRGDVTTKNLTEEDYLLINGSVLEVVPENDLGLSYKDGLLIGAYLGDGSKHYRNNCDSVETTLSLNSDKVSKLSDILMDWGTYESKNSVVFAKTSSKQVAAFIESWVSGKYSNEKRLNLNVILQSEEFRKGILDGYYITDGGNNNRIYTTSEGLSKDIETLLTSLGMYSVINVSDRTDEPVVIRGEEYPRNFPLYCIRFYENSNRRSMAGVYMRRLGNTYFKIKSIEEVDNYEEEFVYCFDMKNEQEPYFTLPNGVVTHNCRLRNELIDNTFSYSLGAGGVSTGSVSVMTINLNRLYQNGTDLAWQVQQIHKYQTAYRSIVEDMLNAKMLPVYDAGFISLDKQFMTVGINGIAEAAESQGLTVGNNPEYIKFVQDMFKIIHTENARFKKEYGLLLNCECIPGESIGAKFAKWDKEDGYKVNRDVYNSYIFLPEDEDCNIFDKLTLHGKDLVQYLDGGSACHINLEEHPSAENYRNIYNLAAGLGANYWTTNVKNTVCNSCGHISKNTFDSCPVCGSKDIDYATRVIGFLKRIRSFSKARREEESRRAYSKV